MVFVRPPKIDFLSNIEDSRRWKDVTFRDGDIVISTPPKCGTTWTQGIVASLLWPAGDAPDDRPWVDLRLAPIEELLASLDALEHRRFIKSHAPLDALPIGGGVRYLVVYRNPADALVSWGNHRAKMQPFVMNLANTAAAGDGLAPLPETFNGDYDELFEEWSTYWSPPRHLASSWDLRHEENVRFLHYADLHRDLATQMRRIAAFLEIPIDEAAFEAQVARCDIRAMREARRHVGFEERGFIGGVDSFYHRGGNGRGRELLTDAHIELVEQHTRSFLSDDAATWVEAGGDVPA